jgi:hypothetical protein
MELESIKLIDSITPPAPSGRPLPGWLEVNWNDHELSDGCPPTGACSARLLFGGGGLVRATHGSGACHRMIESSHWLATAASQQVGIDAREVVSLRFKVS